MTLMWAGPGRGGKGAVGPRQLQVSSHLCGDLLCQDTWSPSLLQHTFAVGQWASPALFLDLSFLFCRREGWI